MDNIFCFRVTISFLQNVCAFRLVPMLFTTLVVFSWVDSSQVCFSKCSILSATLYMLVIRVYFIYMYSFFPLDKKKLYIAIRVFPPLTYYLIPLLSSTCHHFHVPDVVGEWNRHHGNIYSHDAVFQESPKPCTSQSLHYTGYPRGCGQTFVLCVAGICH